MFTLQNLIDAGLPAISTDGTGKDAITEFSRTLTIAEWYSYLLIADPIAAAQADAITGYTALSDWVKTGTADQAETYINNQVWNGADIGTINTYIDAQIPTVTGASLATALTSINTTMAGVRTVLKVAAGAIIGIRALFILTSKLLIHIRDLVIRWRK